MIEANHSRYADTVFGIYIRRMFRKHFNSFNLIGDMPIIDNELPLIITPNHSTWWDGFFLYFINKYFYGRKYYIMMLEDQLRNFPFFAKLGAFSIVQKNPKKIIETLDYSARILSENKNSMLVMFPQGEMIPDFGRPIIAYGGIKKIIEKCDTDINLMTLGVKTCFLKEQLPHVIYSFGQNHICNSSNNINSDILAKELQDNLERIERSILNGENGEEIFHGKTSVSKKYEKEAR
jgi:1-acyl-sn-glycerol-3-phosphate acyltransferase